MQGEHAAAQTGLAAASHGQARLRLTLWIPLVLMLVYFLAVAVLTPHAPFGDDVAIEHEARSFGAAHSLGEAWSALAMQYNEHRPVLVRLVFWATQPLPEAVRYPAIAMFGGLSLVLLYVLFAREARRIQAPAAIFIVLAALLFNLGSSEASLWPMAAVSNFGVLAMMALALRMLSLEGWPAWAALLPAMAALGLQGNGLFVFVLGSTFLMFNGRYILAFLWLAAAALAGFWYFLGYVRPIGGLDPASWATRAVEIGGYVLTFCGAAAAYGGQSLGALNIIFVSVAASVGAVLVAATIYGVVRGGLWRGRIELWINIFVIISGLSAALSRLDYGAQQALAPRYHINSCLMIASTLVYFLGEAGEGGGLARLSRRWAPTLAVLGVIYVAATAPIAWWMHKLHSGEPAAHDAEPGQPQPVDPSWQLDRAAQSSQG